MPVAVVYLIAFVTPVVATWNPEFGKICCVCDCNRGRIEIKILGINLSQGRSFFFFGGYHWYLHAVCSAVKAAVK
jgi:hypothetical protein